MLFGVLDPLVRVFQCKLPDLQYSSYEIGSLLAQFDNLIVCDWINLDFQFFQFTAVPALSLQEVCDVLISV